MRMSGGIAAAGALLAAAAVMLGAFGAHALEGAMTERQAANWATAVQYQLAHALGLLLVALVPLPGRRTIAFLLGGGTLIFSGTLYAMALGLPSWLGAVTPIGGVMMIAGWLWLAGQALRAPRA